VLQKIQTQFASLVHLNFFFLGLGLQVSLCSIVPLVGRLLQFLAAALLYGYYCFE
jgi:hypothetical protein